MDLDFLDNIWKPIGKGLSEADTFMNREMPFNMSWGAPAALVASYFGGPAVMEAMGEAGGASAGGDMLSSIGGSGGTFGGDLFQLGGGVGDFSAINPATGLSWADTGSGLTGNGFNGYTPQEQASLDQLINEQSAKYPMDGSKKPSFQQMLGKQLMQGGLGNSMQQRAGYQHQEQPVQRQAAFLPTPQQFQVQEKPNDIQALVAALRSNKGTF